MADNQYEPTERQQLIAGILENVALTLEYMSDDELANALASTWLAVRQREAGHELDPDEIEVSDN